MEAKRQTLDAAAPAAEAPEGRGGTSGSDPACGPADMAAVRAQFPILRRKIHGRPLVYLDSAASAQQPDPVIDAVAGYARTSHANVHRGAHQLSVEATDAFEDARKTVADHIGAAGPPEIVFTRGTTESLNLVAAAWGGANLGQGDLALLTTMEHHSNLVPWQLLAARTGVELAYVTVTPEGTLDLDDLGRQLARGPRLFGCQHVSNGFGTIHPIADIVARAKAAGAVTVVDGAQAAPHLPVDVGEIGCDFYAFSGHKMCGPTGIGVLWGRRALLDAMPPYQGGGEMISEVTLAGSKWAAVPQKFEAGTPNIGGAVGIAAAIRFLRDVGFDRIAAHEADLTAYALERLDTVEGITLYGPRDARTSVFSFTYGDIHPHDLSTILDHRGIAIRAGHHCNQPLMDHFDISGTARASFYLYNTRADVDALIEGLGVAADVFGVLS